VRAPDAEAYAFGDWVLRTGERELVDKEGREIPLSTGEYNLLLAFVTHPKRVLSRDQLLDLSQGRELAAFERLMDLSTDLRRAHPAANMVSAGMSADLEQAVAAGATHVRVGTAVLGVRLGLG
jgi:DNA-binding response OmpR family regulator